MKDEVLPQCFKVVSSERAMKLFRHAAKVKAELVKKYGIVENIINREAYNDADDEENNDEYTEYDEFNEDED